MEYIVRLRGAAAASAEMRGLAGEMKGLAAAQTKVGESGAAASAGTGRLGSVAGMAGKGVAALAAGLVAVGVEAVKSSTQFNHEMLRIRTDAGASSKELANMKQGVLDLASSGASMGQGPMSLAQGLYHLESLGIRGSKALDALKLASQESAISGANLEQTTSALGAAMYTGIKGTGDLTHLMGILNATVGAGNMRFQDLVDALGTGVLPSAKVAGLSIQDVSAALAVLTDSGMAASSGAAQLATALHFLYAPTNKATGALESIGLKQDSLAQDMHKPQGLLVALTDLRDHLKGLSDVQRAQVLSAILPGGRGRVLLTELTMLDRLKGKYDQINKTAGGFGGSVAAQRKDPQTQLKTAEAGAQAALIRLGNVLTPIVLPALAATIRFGTLVLGWLAKLPAAIIAVVHWFEALGSGSGKVGKAMQSIGSTASSIWRTFKSVFSGIATTAHQVFAGSFGKDLETIGKKLIQFGAVLFRVFGPVLRGLITAVGAIVRGTFNMIAGVVKIVAGLLTGNFSKAWKGIKQVIGGVMSAISGAVRASLAITVIPLWNGLKAVLGIVGAALSWLWHNIIEPFGKFLGAVFSPAISVVKGIFDVLKSAVSALGDALNTVLGVFKSIGNWVSGAGQSVLSFAQSLLGLSQTAGSLPNLPAGAPTGLPGAPTVPGGSNPNGGAVGAPPIIQKHVARMNRAVARAGGGGITIHAQFEHPIVINGHEMARAHRREVIKAMAAGA